MVLGFNLISLLNTEVNVALLVAVEAGLFPANIGYSSSLLESCWAIFVASSLVAYFSLILVLAVLLISPSSYCA